MYAIGNPQQHIQQVIETILSINLNLKLQNLMILSKEIIQWKTTGLIFLRSAQKSRSFAASARVNRKRRNYLCWLKVSGPFSDSYSERNNAMKARAVSQSRCLSSGLLEGSVKQTLMRQKGE